MTWPPRLPHSQRESTGLVFILDVVGLGKRVGRGAVKAEAPVGRVSAEAVTGGLEVEMSGHKTLIANAIVTVSYDVEFTSKNH